MWNKMTNKQLELIPKLYSTDGVPKDKKKVYAKFFIGNFSWYILEFDGKDTFFAYVVSSISPDGEYGYVSLNELLSVKSGYVEVDREIHQVNPRSPKLLSKILKEDRIAGGY